MATEADHFSSEARRWNWITSLFIVRRAKSECKQFFENIIIEFGDDSRNYVRRVPFYENEALRTMTNYSLEHHTNADDMCMP
jgi:hypothetical protein